MGVQNAVTYGAIGFLADRLFGTGMLATFGAALFGGLFTPDAGQMDSAYKKPEAKVGETLKSFFGAQMWDGLFGSASAQQKTPEDLKTSPTRAAAAAQAKEKQTGFPWGKVLLGAGAAVLGINMLDNLVMMPFSNPWYAPFGAYGRMGLGGVLPLAATAMLGLGRYNFLY